ncbi:hypothetical protein GOBAR_AA10655 [Gossypium barbadense]|uniref:CCHC-type domain-containing protein n=1 Tax=Gossypium barbadense TaxID=3634 RepID=A0A2P5Y381_GOSBA|nr:hypothetical protein GOBAR_AA10655 [Gossypium barbadense]
MGTDPQIKDKTGTIIRDEDDDDLELLEEDIMSSSVNGIPEIDFSNRVNQLLIKDMKLAIVIKLLGKNIGYATLQNKIHSLWKLILPFPLMDIENGYYLTTFQNVEDFERVLSQGPWIVYREYLTVYLWSIEFNLSQPYLNMVMAWIRLPGLPGHMVAISTLIMEFGEDSQEWRSTLILERPFRRKFLINGVPQRIEYEGLPTVCFSCGHYGHTQDLCPKSVTTQKPSKENFLDKEPVSENRPELSENNSTNSSGDYDPWMLVKKHNQPWSKEHQNKNEAGNVACPIEAKNGPSPTGQLQQRLDKQSPASPRSNKQTQPKMFGPNASLKRDRSDSNSRKNDLPGAMQTKSG